MFASGSVPRMPALGPLWGGCMIPPSGPPQFLTAGHSVWGVWSDAVGREPEN